MSLYDNCDDTDNEKGLSKESLKEALAAEEKKNEELEATVKNLKAQLNEKKPTLHVFTGSDRQIHKVMNRYNEVQNRHNEGKSIDGFSTTSSLELLGVGGQAQVYSVSNTLDDTKSALKFKRIEVEDESAFESALTDASLECKIHQMASHNHKTKEFVVDYFCSFLLKNSPNNLSTLSAKGLLPIQENDTSSHALSDNDSAVEVLLSEGVVSSGTPNSRLRSQRLSPLKPTSPRSSVGSPGSKSYDGPPPHEAYLITSMEYCSEGTMLEWSEDHCRRGGDLDVSISLLLSAICGIECLHATNIVHRDIHIHNFFVTKNGENLVVKTGDFGLSRTLQYYVDQEYDDPQERFENGIKEDVKGLGKVAFDLINETLSAEDLYDLYHDDFVRDGSIPVDWVGEIRKPKEKVQKLLDVLSDSQKMDGGEISIKDLKDAVQDLLSG